MDNEELEKIKRDNRVHQIISYSRMPVVTRDTHRFETFQINDDNRQAYIEACYQFGLNPNGKEFTDEQFNDYHPSDFILFYGPPGRGKTHLALAMGWYNVLEWRNITLYWQVEDFLDSIRYSYMANDGEWKNLIEGTKNAELLIFDDLGAQKDTEWARAKLDLIIDHRYINGCKTVFTTNVPPNKLSDRLSSRIAEGTICQVGGEDFRLLKARKREYARFKNVNEN